jgi:DNA-binding IclR family transcriptional regulator
MVQKMKNQVDHVANEDAEEADQSGVQSVNRAMDLLLAFPKYGPEIGLSALARQLNLNKTTTYRILKTLEGQGFIARSPDGRSYRLGMRVFELGAYYQSQLNVRRLSLPHLLEVTNRTREATFLCVREGNEALCIERVEAKHSNEYFALRVGGRQPLHCGGASRVLMLTLNDEEVEAYASQTGLKPLTPHSITTLDQLKEDISRTRTQGYAFSNEDVTLGIAAIGAPIRDYSGKVIAAVSVSGIAQSFRERLAELSFEITRTASLISTQMGYWD